MPASFSIITPSYRSGSWLKLCIASVADQEMGTQHIVQDAGSDDGTLDWLPGDRRVQVFVEQDSGMYDAINRGLRRSTGDVLGWLNCDEQYLPGTLKRVADYFEANPTVEVVFGDVIMTGPGGEYLWHRKMQVPLHYHTWTCHLSTLSCATFFRRRVVFGANRFFDPSLRDVGDGEWMVRLLKDGVRMGTLDGFTSTFTQTGRNMSIGSNARREARALCGSAPLWVRALKPWWILQHRFRRWAGGMYFQAPFAYALYTQTRPNRRQVFEVHQPASRRPLVA